MAVAGHDKALNRSEELATFLLKITDTLPNIVPLKGDFQEKLHNLRSAIQGMRPARIMIIGRCKAGKSSLINAICGLKVAQVSDTKPETGAAEWKEYYHNGSTLLRILDTRGLQEAEAPRQADSANNPYDSIMRAVTKECPDVVLFLCKASEAHSAVASDLSVCASILTEIRQRYRRDLPVIGVLTKCDEMAPPYIRRLPTDNEKKNRNIQDQVQSFHAYLKGCEELRHHIKAVVPTAAYAEYEEGENGLILPEHDYRWNIDQLVATLIQYTPRETRGTIARMANLTEFQLSVARTVVGSCSALSGVVAFNPIPGVAVPIVGAIQSFMVMYIGWLGGREFSEQTLKDFMVTLGVGVGMNAAALGIADAVLKFIPGFGHVVAATAGASATQGLGDAAIVYFLNNGKPKTAY